MLLILIRGIARIIAAAAALLMSFGIVYTMEGITERIPVSLPKEILTEGIILGLFLGLLLAGGQDLAKATRHKAVFWIVALAGLTGVYYLNHATTDRMTTKVIAPLLALGLAVIPYFGQRLNWLYGVCSVSAGAFALYLSWILIQEKLAGSGVFFQGGILGLIWLGFILTSIIALVLTLLQWIARILRRGNAAQQSSN